MAHSVLEYRSCSGALLPCPRERRTNHIKRRLSSICQQASLQCLIPTSTRYFGNECSACASTSCVNRTSNGRDRLLQIFNRLPYATGAAADSTKNASHKSTQAEISARVSQRQRTIEHISITVITLSIIWCLDIRIRTHEPPQRRIINPTIHMDQAQLLQVLMVRKSSVSVDPNNRPLTIGRPSRLTARGQQHSEIQMQGPQCFPARLRESMLPPDQAYSALHRRPIGCINLCHLPVLH